MSRDDPRVRLRHMLDYGREAVALMRDRNRADLDIDRALGLAIIRCLEILGEAAGRISVGIRKRIRRYRGRKSLACVIASCTAMT